MIKIKILELYSEAGYKEYINMPEVIDCPDLEKLPMDYENIMGVPRRVLLGNYKEELELIAPVKYPPRRGLYLINKFNSDDILYLPPTTTLFCIEVPADKATHIEAATGKYVKLVERLLVKLIEPIKIYYCDSCGTHSDAPLAYYNSADNTYLCADCIEDIDSSEWGEAELYNYFWPYFKIPKKK